MKFVDDLYELYKNQLTGDEEDAVIIVSGIISELDSDHLVEIIRSMSHAELYEMLGTFMVDKLRNKLVQDGAGSSDFPISREIH